MFFRPITETVWEKGVFCRMNYTKLVWYFKTIFQQGGKPATIKNVVSYSTFDII